jgi:hypothetical protein
MRSSEPPHLMFTLFNKLNNFISHSEDIVLELCIFELEGVREIWSTQSFIDFAVRVVQNEIFYFWDLGKGEVGVVLPSLKAGS